MKKILAILFVSSSLTAWASNYTLKWSYTHPVDTFNHPTYGTLTIDPAFYGGFTRALNDDVRGGYTLALFTGKSTTNDIYANRLLLFDPAGVKIWESDYYKIQIVVDHFEQGRFLYTGSKFDDSKISFSVTWTNSTITELPEPSLESGVMGYATNNELERQDYFGAYIFDTGGAISHYWPNASPPEIVGISVIVSGTNFIVTWTSEGSYN